MTIPAILAPVFVQVLLTFLLLLWTARQRFGAARAGLVRREDVSMGEKAWPAPAQQASNAFSHQFEIPVLFLVLVPLAIITRKADLLFVVLSWVFVLTRIAHALVYVTSNRVPVRLGLFVLGAVVLMVMWAMFAIRVFAAPVLP